MDIEKYYHPDSNRNLSIAQLLFWYICILLPFIGFAIISGYELFIYFAGDDNKSYNISNVGFAILVGLSSACFSYYKLLENCNYIRLHKDLQRSGELFLISAIAFLISSALKFSWSTHNPGNWLQKDGLKIMSAYTFFVAETICIYGLAKLIDVLHRRITNSDPPLQIRNLNESTGAHVPRIPLPKIFFLPNPSIIPTTFLPLPHASPLYHTLPYRCHSFGKLYGIVRIRRVHGQSKIHQQHPVREPRQALDAL